MTRQSVLLILLSLLLSCGGDKPKKEKPPERVFNVTTMPVLLREYPLTYTTSGRFEAVDLVKLKPEVSAKVEQVLFEEGQRVRKGEILIELEDSRYRKLYEEIKSQRDQVLRELENAEEVYERREGLFKKGLIGEEEFKTALTRVETLKARLSSLSAALSRARLDLEKTKVKSPVDGIVQRRLVSEGDYVTPQTTLAEILKNDEIRFSFKLPPEIALGIREGHPIEIRALGKKFPSKIAYISPSADASGMFLLKAYLRSWDLRPNLYGEVTFNFGKVRAIKVSESAVQMSARQTFLWVVRDSRAVKLPVEVLYHDGGEVILKGNFKEGDRIVIEGFMSLYEGARVKER